MRRARFELVRSDAGHFARFIASNGREVWRTSEVYTRRRAAEHAVEILGLAMRLNQEGGIDVRVVEVDEREAP